MNDGGPLFINHLVKEICTHAFTTGKRLREWEERVPFMFKATCTYCSTVFPIPPDYRHECALDCGENVCSIWCGHCPKTNFTTCNVCSYGVCMAHTTCCRRCRVLACPDCLVPAEHNCPLFEQTKQDVQLKGQHP